MSRLFITTQYIVPQHVLSRLTGWLANCRIPWFKNLFIRWFIKRFKVNMAEAVQDSAEDFACFNDFFTRALKAGARPVVQGAGQICCPADGSISEIGAIINGQLLQAKGQRYSLRDLLGGDAMDATAFSKGSFATLYLSPRDYHRVHMPLAGRLLKTIYLPGKLFSVNQTTSESVRALFARNERLVCFFDTEAGPMALILVGAMIVAAISTVWGGLVCPGISASRQLSYQQHVPPIKLATGAEMGRFSLGSTAIVLFSQAAVTLNPALRSGDSVRMGELLGTVNPAK
jgi:phosphatidylserine decarboxylase